MHGRYIDAVRFWHCNFMREQSVDPLALQANSSLTFIICSFDFESSIIQDHRPLPRPDPATTADHTRNIAANNTLTRSDFGAAEPDRNLREIPPRRQSAGPMRRPVCRWMGQKSVAVHRAYVHVNHLCACESDDGSGGAGRPRRAAGRSHHVGPTAGHRVYAILAANASITMA